MGDMGDFWREEHARRRKVKEQRRAENERLLEESGLPFRLTNNDTCWCLREPGKPRVDVYPGTGRWRDVDAGRTINGEATAFLAWYAKQEAR